MATIIVKLIGAFFATVAAAFTVAVPKFLIMPAGVVGAISYLFFLITLQFSGEYVANFVACIIFAILGQIMARIYKAPVTMFYIPSFFLYVPGTSIYRTAFYFIQGNYSESQFYLIQTLTLAGIIAIGVFIVDSSVETYYHIKHSYQARGKS